MNRSQTRALLTKQIVIAVLCIVATLGLPTRLLAGGAAQADFDSLIELIQNTIQPDSWIDVGGDGNISEFPANLSLVIRQTQDVHEEIADLLEQLRRLQDLQVTIEVRFITLNDNFFERIGVDFDFDIDDNVTTLPPDDSGPSVSIGLNQDGAPTADFDFSFTQDSFDATVPTFGGFDPGSASTFGFAILSDIEAYFVVAATQGDTRTNVLQAPKVTLFNGQLANISDTSQRPFVTSVVPVVGDFAPITQLTIQVEVDENGRMQLIVRQLPVGGKELSEIIFADWVADSDAWSAARIKAATAHDLNTSFTTMDLLRHITYVGSLESAEQQQRLTSERAYLDSAKLDNAVVLGVLQDNESGRRRTPPLVELVDAPQGESPIVVAVLDTGVDVTHPQLIGKIWHNRNEIPSNGIDDDGNGYVDDYFGFNTGGNNADIRDEIGHGTFVAGLIAARGNNDSIGGIAPDARVMVLKVANDQGTTDIARLGLAVQYAVMNGAKIINVSAAGPAFGDVDRTIFDWATKQGVLVVAASGSSAKNTSEVVPAGLPNVLTVGATDQEDQRASFSGWGHELDMVAPGVGIFGLRAFDTDFMHTMTSGTVAEGVSIVDELAYRAEGTSFAAPLVAAAAARLWQESPEMSAEQIKNKLIMSADDVSKPGWDRLTGAGRLNVKRALTANADHFLITTVAGASLATVSGRRVLRITGTAFGTDFSKRELYVAFGDNPDDNDWRRVLTSDEPIRATGVLGTVPGSTFDRVGKWSLKTVATDRRGTVREAQAVIAIK